MENQMKINTNNRNQVWGFLSGLLVGVLAGSAAMLLYAPQSGKRTRAKIMRTTTELRNQASDAVEDALTQTRDAANQIKTNVYDQVGTLQQRSQDVLDEQKKRLSTFVEAGKAKVQDVLS